MKTFLTATRSFLLDEEGVTAIEYGLIASLIVLASIVTLGLIGDSLNAAFVRVNGGLAP